MLTSTEVVVDTAPSGVIRAGETLKGFRVDMKFFYDHILKNYSPIGDGTCVSKQKKVNLFADKSGNIYGASTILDYRYFELRRAG